MGDVAASISVKVLKADGVKLNNSGAPPSVVAQLRINVGGRGEQPLKTAPAAASTSPEWNQQFVLPVRDPQTSQLECKLWDDSEPNNNNANFLGEVILNLAKLVPYKGQYIEQVFDIKQGKLIKTDKPATGKLKMGLQLDSPAVMQKAQAPATSTDSGVRATSSQEPPPASYPVRPAPNQPKLVVSVVQASNLPSVDGNAPDAYAAMTIDIPNVRDVSGRTSVVRRNNNPRFEGSEFVFGIDDANFETSQLSLTVSNWNGGKDRMIGKITPFKILEVTRTGSMEEWFELKDERGNLVHGANNQSARVNLRLSVSGYHGRTSGVHSPLRHTSTADATDSPGAPRVLGIQRTPQRSQPLPGGGPAEVGLLLAQGQNNQIAVSNFPQNLVPGLPAAASGKIKLGDLLIDVDGHDIVGRPVAEVQNMLRGERNSPVTMIFRRGAEQVVVTLLRTVAGGAPPAPQQQQTIIRSQTQTVTQQAYVPPQQSQAPAKPIEQQGLSPEQLNTLKKEFSNLSFLWGDNINDASYEGIVEWKKKELYGPKREFPDTSHEVDDRTVMSSSYRSFSGRAYTPTLAPMSTGLPYVNPPMYRSFDQGSLMSYSSRNGPYAVSQSRIQDPVMRIAPVVRDYRDGSALRAPMDSSAMLSQNASILSMSRDYSRDTSFRGQTSFVSSGGASGASYYPASGGYQQSGGAYVQSRSYNTDRVQVA